MYILNFLSSIINEILLIKDAHFDITVFFVALLHLFKRDIKLSLSKLEKPLKA